MYVGAACGRQQTRSKSWGCLVLCKFAVSRNYGFMGAVLIWDVENVL